MGSNYNLGASVVYHKTVVKFETFQQCQQSIKSTHNASILSSIIAVSTVISVILLLTHRSIHKNSTGISSNLYVLSIGTENKEILFCWLTQLD